MGDAYWLFLYRRNSSEMRGLWRFGTAQISAFLFGAITTQTTTVKEGFSNNENFIVKIWDGSLGKEYPANITYSAGTAYFNSTFSVVGTLSAVLTQIQAMPLSQGWNWISSNLTPSNLNMDTIANNIKSRVTLLRNGGGQMYWPTYGINSIGKLERKPRLSSLYDGDRYVKNNWNEDRNRRIALRYECGLEFNFIQKRYRNEYWLGNSVDKLKYSNT